MRLAECGHLLGGGGVERYYFSSNFDSLCLLLDLKLNRQIYNLPRRQFKPRADERGKPALGNRESIISDCDEVK